MVGSATDETCPLILRRDSGYPQFPFRRADLRRELVDGALVVRTAMHGRAEEAARASIHHAVVGKGTVRRTVEAVHHTFRPAVVRARRELVKHARPACAAVAGGAVEIARTVEIHVRDGARTIVAALEAVEHA